MSSVSKLIFSAAIAAIGVFAAVVCFENPAAAQNNAWRAYYDLTIVIERQPDGKMRATLGSWDWEKVFLRDQVLEVGNVEG